VKGSRRLPRTNPSRGQRVQIQPESYLFYEKRTGTTHFQVQADPSGDLPTDHAAALLAMHCLVRGQSPSDYAIMVKARNSLADGLKSRAEALLEVGRLVSAPAGLSRREEEVLRRVLQGCANKEIASDLNLSERTVKFHVSSLLAKFQVRNRMELAREASRTSLSAPPTGSLGPGVMPAIGGPIHPVAVSGAAVHRAAHKGAVVPMRGRQMTA
jgi:DNA-binding CsgD family transcriptional regulator